MMDLDLTRKLNNQKESLPLSKRKGLSTIIDGRINLTRLSNNVSLPSIWGADSFGLENLNYYLQEKEEIRKKILEVSARSRLNEACHIEKCGMNFTAKMALLSESLQEKKLYSLFSADEARHLSYLEKILQEPSDIESNAFLSLLSDVIANGERRPLIFIVQIFLEGWGIEHYQMMAATCKNAMFRNLIVNIVQDEAAHHGSGLVLFNENELTVAERKYIIETLNKFFQMIQLGPVGLMNNVAQVLGGFSKGQKINFLKAINSEESTNQQLLRLKKLMKKSESFKLIREIEKKGAFVAFTATESISLMEAH